MSTRRRLRNPLRSADTYIEFTKPNLPRAKIACQPRYGWSQPDHDSGQCDDTGPVSRYMDDLVRRLHRLLPR